jgi:hypothetical protein
MMALKNSEKTCSFDLVLAFPYADYDEKTHLKYTQSSFVNRMLGIRKLRTSGGAKREEFVDEARRILKTARCFMTADGGANSVLDSIHQQEQKTEDPEELEKLRIEAIVEMKHVLEKEYETFCETTKETTAKKFHELILNSIVKRLQLVCGLTARMKMSMKGDEVIVAVHADLEDLVTTCASYKHAHHICSHPGGHCCHSLLTACYCAITTYQDDRGRTEQDPASDAQLSIS